MAWKDEQRALFCSYKGQLFLLDLDLKKIDHGASLDVLISVMMPVCCWFSVSLVRRCLCL